MTYDEMARLWLKGTETRNHKAVRITPRIYYLHDNPIMEKVAEEWIRINPHGYYTKTTQAHINRILTNAGRKNISRKTLRDTKYLALACPTAFFQLNWSLTSSQIASRVEQVQLRSERLRRDVVSQSYVFDANISRITLFNLAVETLTARTPILADLIKHCIKDVPMLDGWYANLSLPATSVLLQAYNITKE